jgi:hypothetical protein
LLCNSAISLFLILNRLAVSICILARDVFPKDFFRIWIVNHQGRVEFALRIAIGVFLVVLSLPGSKFYEGLGTRQALPPIEPVWIGRLVILMAGLAAILGGIWEIHRGGPLILGGMLVAAP